MDKAIQSAIKLAEQLRKPADSVPWKPDEPHGQTPYEFDASTVSWKEVSTSTSTSTSSQTGSGEVKRLALFSWNIDFMLPFAESRMKAGLSELYSRITSSLAPDTAAVIFLQECLAADLDTIGATSWVREKFYRTDVDVSNWASAFYGTTTLVDRRLRVDKVFRVHFAETKMERDALFVDVDVAPAGGEKKKKIVRFCNSHLESLIMEPPLRPAQVALAAKYMHGQAEREEQKEGKDSPKIHGALMAGDFNAIQSFDRTLHAENALKDAYLELGGKEDSEDGYTWGQQAPTDFRERFGCSRMDKVFYCGGVQVKKFERFGQGVEVADPKEREEIVNLGIEKGWITDHLGVFAEIDVVDEGA
jgi:tyrosyl-DNA phosphodiesterase 2